MPDTTAPITRLLAKEELAPFERIDASRSMASLFLSWAVVAVAVWGASRSSWWLYPFFALVIANRQLALTLIGHEGLHGNLFRSRFWNDFAGRYLCLFPVFVSFSRYKAKHIIHNFNIGTPLDTDLGLYSLYPMEAGKFSRLLLLRTLTGRVLWDFLNYYVEVPALIRGNLGIRKGRTVFTDNDLLPYLAFHAAVALALWQLSLLPAYLLYWILTLLLSLPYNFFIGGLQHGPLRREAPISLRNRTVTGPKWLMEILLPVDINFHAEHHLFPSVPHTQLRRLSAHLDERGAGLWRESYAQALRTLLSP